MEKIVTLGDAKRAVAALKDLLNNIEPLRDRLSVHRSKELMVLGFGELDRFITSEIDKAAEAGRKQPTLDTNTHYLDQKLSLILGLLQHTSAPAPEPAADPWEPKVGDKCSGPLGAGTIIGVSYNHQLALVEYKRPANGYGDNMVYEAWTEWSNLRQTK